MSETPEGVYRAAAEAEMTKLLADFTDVNPDAREWAIADLAQSPGHHAAVDAAYAAGHVDGAVAERGRITRIIRRHANSAGLPLGVSNALSRIVDEMEGPDA